MRVLRTLATIAAVTAVPTLSASTKSAAIAGPSPFPHLASLGSSGLALAATSITSGGSDCCSPNDFPGCDDASCQAVVCASDPFCCDTEWDGTCAGAAASFCPDLCPFVCPPSNHDCFTTGTPGCTDIDCCEAVCTFDPFCCDVAWDGLCVSGALSLLPDAPAVSASQTTVCCGASVSLTATSNDSSATIMWREGSCAGPVIGVGSPLSVNPTTTTTYVASAANACGESPCDSVTVAVAPDCSVNPPVDAFYVIIGAANNFPWDWEIVGTNFTITGTTPAVPIGGSALEIAQAFAGVATTACASAAAGCSPIPEIFVDAYVLADCTSRAVIVIRACDTQPVKLFVRTPGGTMCDPPPVLPADVCDLDASLLCRVNPSIGLIETLGLDCNGNGLDDAIDILIGESLDLNGNGIPDECESCLGDLNDDGVVDGADLGILLNDWASSGGTTGADLNGDGLVDGADLGILLNAWGPCPDSSPLLLAYDGFADRVDGADLTLDPAGNSTDGIGWTGGWRGARASQDEGAAPFHWRALGAGLDYVDVDGNALQTVDGAADAGVGAIEREIDLDGPAFGTIPETVWISMLAIHSAEDPIGSWLGLRLGGLAADAGLFIGKPRGDAHWGIAHRGRGDRGIALGDSVDNPDARRASTVRSDAVTLIVARIDFHDGSDDVTVWLNPPLSSEPDLDTAAIVASRFGAFGGITTITLDFGPGNGAAVGLIDEIRIGTSFEAVCPIAPAGDHGGVLESDPAGGSTANPVLPDSDPAETLASPATTATQGDLIGAARREREIVEDDGGRRSSDSGVDTSGMDVPTRR